MSSERGGLLKTRAENFARRLQTRLRSLSDAEDSSWASEVSSSSDNDIYYDIDSSLASPEEEVSEPIFIAMQNRDSLQRNDSSGSQYFDTVENLEDHANIPLPNSPILNLKKIPILHLKTERPAPITNGYTNLLDADLGCSTVHEMPSLELEPEVSKRDTTENNCDSNALVDNKNRWREKEEHKVMEPGVEVCNCEVAMVQVDIRPIADNLSADVSDEAMESTSKSFCVFCDIEQIKSSLSTKCTEPDSDVDITSNQYEAVQLEEKLERPSSIGGPLNSEGSSMSECPVDEENVSLTDLLQVLKQEISTGIEQKEDNLEVVKTDHLDNSQSVYPSIEVRESSPELAKSDVEKEGDEEEDFDSKRKSFRRSSSLKTGKTPPGTPSRKKIVRFADVLGLDLADVKTFLDEVPTIPKSAYEDLHGIELSLPVLDSPTVAMTVVTPQVDKIVVPLFSQPGAQPNFLDRVRENCVCLESAYVSDMSLCAISGLVRVKNIDFHKSVHVRYTINNWSSYSDLQAKYVRNSCDGFSDKFTFVLYAHTLGVGQRLEFAIRFHTAGAQFWDSNVGRNYIFECTRGPTKTTDAGVPPSPIETWASFY